MTKEHEIFKLDGISFGSYSASELSHFLKLRPKDGTHIDTNGTIVSICNGRFHAIEEPAIKWYDGSEIWLYYDRRHRMTGPAVTEIVTESRTVKKWYQHGNLHRIDGPAIEDDLGTDQFFLHGKEFTNLVNWAITAGIYHTDTFVELKLKYGN